MQSLQRTILNKLQPGKEPIFIIAPNRNDGDELALLISNNVEVGTPKADRFLGVSRKNYFSNADTRQFLPKTVDKKKIEDCKAVIKLLVEQGFDNHLLWGLQLDYELFFEAGVDSLYPNASFIFLYGTAINRVGSIKQDHYLSDVLSFCKSKPQNCLLYATHSIKYISSVVLKSIPFTPDVKVTEIEDAAEYSVSYDVKAIAASKELNPYFQQLHQHNTLLTSERWISGAEVQILMLYEEKVPDQILLNKIFQYFYSFAPNPLITIICNKRSAKDKLEQLFVDHIGVLADIEIVTDDAPIVKLVNNQLAKTSAKYILLDALFLSFSTSNIFLPLIEQSKPKITFGYVNQNAGIANSYVRLSQIDLLTIESLPSNLLFQIQDWNSLKGFDVNLDMKFSIWDFCIRMLQNNESFAIQAPAQLHTKAIYFEEDDTKTSEDKYKAIIEKHKQVFEQHLSHVLAVVAEQQHLPQDQIVKLNYRINTLQSLINHSKDELRAVSEQKSQLQNHIMLLESRWYFKIANKIGHFKSLFFKESSNKGTGILKVIKFVLFAFTKPGFRVLRRVMKAILKKLYMLAEDRPVKILYLDETEDGEVQTNVADNYHDWIVKKLNGDKLRADYDANYPKLLHKPKISIIMPVYNPPVEFLKQAIESVKGQMYSNWELCIADDCSTNPQVHKLLNMYAMTDPRIQVVFRKENGHISACSNSALELASGEFVLCLDHDDLLTPNCTLEVVKYINQHPDIDVVYSDEDKVDEVGNFSFPYFKPDWAPDNLTAKNYITHIAVFRKSLLDKLGGYRLGFEGSQDYDLILRAADATNKIGHIPKVLYHWRMHELSAAQQQEVKPYAFMAAKKALEESLQRKGLEGDVQYLPGLMGYRIKYAVTKPAKVSILIPTKDQAKLMRNTIDSLINLTDYPDYEIVVLNNNSTTDEFYELMKHYEEKYPKIFKCLEAKFPFNFSKLMNVGAQNSTGEYILMLNNDVEITHADWLSTMVSYAQQQRIGAVGVKLLYPDDTIQHAGTVIGLGGVAGHVFVHLYKDEPGYFSYLQSTTNYSAVTAACLMVRRSVFDEVNGMDEKLEVEFNDVDFCLKVMDKGYNNVYLPDVVLYHYESATRGHPHQNKVSYERHLREVKYFKDKWAHYIKRDPFFNPNLSLDNQNFSINYKY